MLTIRNGKIEELCRVLGEEMRPHLATLSIQALDHLRDALMRLWERNRVDLFLSQHASSALCKRRHGSSAHAVGYNFAQLVLVDDSEVHRICKRDGSSSASVYTVATGAIDRRRGYFQIADHRSERFLTRSLAAEVNRAPPPLSRR